MNSPTHEPKSPTKDEKTEGSIDFDNLMEKQRELLKHIRSSPDKKKDKLTLDATPPPTAPDGQEWGWSFERIPSSSRNSSAALAAASPAQKKAVTKKQKRKQAEEWISDWHYERVGSQKPQEAAPSFNGHDSESTSQWYFERIPPSQKTSEAHNDEVVMEMDDFAALEAAVADVDPDDEAGTRIS